MDNTFNAQPYDKPKDVVDEDTKYALDLDSEDKAFEADFNWLIENKTVLQT